MELLESGFESAASTIQLASRPKCFSARPAGLAAVAEPIAGNRSRSRKQRNESQSMQAWQREVVISPASDIDMCGLHLLHVTKDMHLIS